MQMLLWAIPIFFVTMLLEWLLTLKHDVRGYWPKDWAANIAMGLGNLAVMFTFKSLTLLIFLAIYQFRWFDIPAEAWWAWLLLIPCEDFCYYWFHRASHEIRFFWAAHVNHHSATSYNLSTALRQSWTSPLFEKCRRVLNANTSVTRARAPAPGAPRCSEDAPVNR